MLAILFGGSPASRAAEPLAAGAQIYAKNQTAKIRIDTTTIGVSGDLTYPCRVRKATEEWLWVWVGGKKSEGWIKRADVCTANEATEYFTKQLADDPKDAYALLQRARAWEELGALDKAIADDTQLIALAPKAFAYNERGLKYFAQQDYTKAQADFDKALDLDPKFALARNNRGNLERAQKKFDAALIDYNEAIRLDDRNPLFYGNCANAWLEKGNLDQALANLDQAIPLDPKNAMLHLNRGTALLEKGEPAKASEDFQQAVQFDPNVAESRNNLAWLRATAEDDKLRDGAAAVRHATRACELSDWKNGGFLDTLAAAYAEAGDFDKAIETEQKALAVLPSAEKADSEAHLERFRAKQPLRDSGKKPAAK
ncbi:MAG TPA: tetratricopeptide repeat protein [Pirellulales bacterium]|nr:tetratricopeptide repeat protein [Pirellulales bacterium]